jgi:enamine deaminase RidA (YjgF/YER057c/UK114 family)
LKKIWYEPLNKNMNKQINHPNEEAWHWRQETPFAQTVAVDDQIFISGQLSLDSNGVVLNQGDIAGQTRNVFENMKQCLAELDLTLSDLVRLNTYYVFNGDDADATQYWEDMTRVRLEYFPDPGPAATAVRIKGMPYKGQLIQIEGVALRGDSRKNRQRIMPEGSWDWSIAVPLSQGWKVGNRIFVGGQISADKNGASVHVGDLDAQTRNIFKYIGNVLSNAGSSFKDIVHIKVCFKYDSRNPSTGVAFADRILEISKEVIDGPAPVLTAFGVDLLYPGLDLEIDAMAIIDADRKTTPYADAPGQYQPEVFSQGVSAAGEIYVAGQTALNSNGGSLSESDFKAQSKVVYERLIKVLAQSNASPEDVVKLNLFIVGSDDEIEESFHQASRLWEEMCPNAHPCMTAVRVHELAKPDLLIQADCIALK